MCKQFVLCVHTEVTGGVHPCIPTVWTYCTIVYIHSAIRDLPWGGLYTYRIITIQLSPGVFNKESLGYPVK